MTLGFPMAKSFGSFDPLLAEVLGRSFLAGASPEGLDQVLDSARLLHAPAGALGYRPYEPGAVAIVLNGLLRAYLTSPQGRQITIKYGVPGDVFGLPTLTGGPVPVAVEVLQESDALVLDPAAVERLCLAEPQVCWRMAEDIGGDFCDLVSILAENLFDSVPSRVARHLLELAEVQTGGLVVRKTQQELANAVGSVREVISRTLKKFQTEGLVEIVSDGISLTDVPGLKAESRKTQA